jgi:hypothetical protein
LTTTAKTYEISFYYTGDTLETRIEFLFGGAVGKVTLDDVVLLQVASEEVVVPVLDKLVAPVNGVNHTIATNHVGIGPYDGGVGYNGQLRFVWFEKGTENIKGSDVFAAPAGVGYAYIYTTFLESLPDGVYTVKFQAVGDQVLGLDSDFSIHTFEVSKLAEVIEEGTTITLDFGTVQKTGYALGTFTFINTGSTIEYTFSKDRAQIATSANEPHTSKGAFVVFAPISTAKESYVEMDLTSFTDLSKISFNISTWSATALTNINALANKGTFGLQFYNPTTQAWEFVKTINNAENIISKLSSTEYVNVEFTVTQSGRYRLYYNSPDATSTTNTAYAITVDDFKLTYVEVPVAVKLPTPVNGFNHTVATNHVGIGPYAGGTGYTGQLRFVWLEKGTENVKGTDLFNAPAGAGLAYIYTTFLATLPDGVYTVKFQAVGDQVLGLDSDFFPTTFEVTKAAPVPQFIGYNVLTSVGTRVTYSGTTANWWEKNVQLILDSFDGTKTTATFDFKGVAGQEYVLKIEGAAPSINRELTITATGLLQTVVLDISGLDLAQRNGLRLAIVFAKTLNGAGTFDVYNVKEATTTKSWVGFGMTLAKFDVFAFPQAPTEWWNNNVQLDVLEFDGKNDRVSFTFKGTLGVNYVFKIEDKGTPNNVELSAVGTGEDQTVILDLSNLSKTVRDNLDLIIIFDKDSANGSRLELNKIEYIEANEPEWVGFGFTVGTRTLVSYSGTTSAWWTNNVQLRLDAFDGTKTTATFEFIGVAGQTYLFKIEGGGSAVEAPIVADGTKQTIALNLAGLTEAQRNGLNLVVVFAQTLNGAGTLELFTVSEATVSQTWIGFGMTVAIPKTFIVPFLAPETFYNNNAQLVILDFDETKTQVTFNFVGKVGVEYLFKIESSPSVFVEKAIVATGDLQAHTLDLSGLTPEQRSALNLIIVFALDTNGSTLSLFSVVYS